MAADLQSLRALVGLDQPGVVVERAPETPPLKLVFGFDADGVQDSEDLRRVLALPRRDPTITPEEVEALTLRYRRPGGTMVLRALQALFLRELVTYGAVAGDMQVGIGKTLALLLAATVLDAKATLLLVPASLVDQVRTRMWGEYARHFRIPNLAPSKGFTPPQAYGDTDALLYVESYQGLSSPKRANLLRDIHFDLVLLDEAHQVRNAASVRGVRFRRDLRHDQRVVPVSGTLISRSIRDGAELLGLALGDLSPLPRSHRTTGEWAGVLDPERPGQWSSPAGVLEVFGGPAWGNTGDVRLGFQARLRSTPGFILSGEDRPREALNIHRREVQVSEEAARAMARLRDEWVTPWDEPIDDALTFYRYATQLAAGLNYRRTWPRGEPEDVRREWLEARREWSAEVREYLGDGRAPRGLDSPHLLEVAATEGRWPSSAWPRWASIRHQAKPSREVVWTDHYLVEDAVAWGREHRGIIWYDHDALGREIAKVGGFRLYRGGPKAGKEILELEGKDTVVLSRETHGTGRDGLQRLYSEQLITTIPTTNQEFEQLLGRLHRPHQVAPEVETWIYCHTPELVRALRSARAEAEMKDELEGSPQKLCYATYSFTP